MNFFLYQRSGLAKKMNYWSSKCLSKVGHEVIIKSVLQSTLSYVISIFQLSASLITTIERMVNSFWWGHGVGETLRLFHVGQWLSHMQMDNVDFMVYSKTTNDPFHSYGMIFQNSVEFKRRQTNEVVHALAGEVALSAIPNIYFDIPHCINNIIINKML